MSDTDCLLIRHARILLPNGEFMMGDVKTEGGKILKVAADISNEEAVTEIEAEGLTLLPGVIDP